MRGLQGCCARFAGLLCEVCRVRNMYLSTSICEVCYTFAYTCGVIEMDIKKLSKITKSNELNNANFTDFNLSCYRVVLNLISKMQRHDIDGNRLALNVVSRECSLSAKEYAKEFNLEGNTAYEILKTTADKLMKTSFAIKTPKGVLKINVCGQAFYAKDEGRIDIRFTEEIMPYLAELGSQFTMYNLKDIAGFDSFYTTRLYELIMQYKTTGVLKITVKNLRFSLGCTNTLGRYNDFKRFGFGHAINEINSQWMLALDYKEVKVGRTVETIIFTFNQTFVRKVFDTVRKKMRSQSTRPRRKIKIEKDTE